METWKKKLVTIITERAIESEVVEVLQKSGARGYTVSDVRGGGAHGTRSGAEDQSANVRIETICEAVVASQISERLYGEFFKNYAMVIYLADIETLRGDKF
jgi:nitrogen regulatory protein PII